MAACNSHEQFKYHFTMQYDPTITFKELKKGFQEENTRMKQLYGEQFPSLPLIMRKRNKRPYNHLHTQSVLTGYYGRVFNFLEAQKSRGLELQSFNNI